MDLLRHINVLAELERLGQDYLFKGEEEVAVLCPFHQDKSPSLHINVNKRCFKCHVAGCEKEGDFISYMCAVVKQTKSVVTIELAKRYGIESGKVIDPSVVERAHHNIWTARVLLKELYERGVTDDLIRKKRYGEMNGRVSIPVKGETDLYVNIRQYKPGAPGKEKMRNLKGCGKQRLYPIDQLQFGKIVWCGGEIKADVAAEILNPHGYGCLTSTAGEENFDVSLLPKLAGKDMWILLDVDKAGRTATELRAAQFYTVAASVHTCCLPLDIVKYPRGDINDFVYWEKGDLLKVVEDGVEWQPKRSKFDDSDPVDLSLVQAINAESTGKRIRVKAVVTSMDTAPYVVPAKVISKCDKQQAVCGLCPLYTGGEIHDIHRESPGVLEMLQTTKNGVRDGIMASLEIPKMCPVVSFEPIEYYNVEDVRISPQLEVTSRSSDRVLQPALCIGKGLELNESYNLVGRMYPHPKTQQSTLLIGSYDPTQDALGNYECGDGAELMVFQPDEWTAAGVGRKLSEIYTDFEANVTRIFQRRDLHLVADLTYHSVLNIRFDGKSVKGWVESLIVGDSAQGKSEVCCGSSGPGGLMAHYGLGEKVECKNATVAGLLGGLQQSGNRFWVSWGYIPTHDKRLVILEELKGASQEVIGKLTDMRSSGIAEIPKIEKRRTHARTRLIALSNPRSGHPVSTYNFGIEVIRELIGGLEDIRRFDLCYIVAAGEINGKLLNQLQTSRPQVDHVFTGELCRRLILWTWTRTIDQVVFDDSASIRVLEAATQLCEKFSDAIPVVDRGSMRYKIARLSAALAGRTFSTAPGDVNTLLVRDCHVEYVRDMLLRIYGSHTFGYSDFTSAMAINNELVDEEMIRRKIESLPYPGDFIKQMIRTNKMDMQDIQDWCGWERPEATDLISFLVRKHALRRDGRAYRKTPPFIYLLKSMLEGGSFQDRPNFPDEPEY